MEIQVQTVFYWISDVNVLNPTLFLQIITNMRFMILVIIRKMWRSIGKGVLNKTIDVKVQAQKCLNFDVNRFVKYSFSYRTSQMRQHVEFWRKGTTFDVNDVWPWRLWRTSYSYRAIQITNKNNHQKEDRRRQMWQYTGKRDFTKRLTSNFRKCILYPEIWR